jgi:hypothetical protein
MTGLYAGRHIQIRGVSMKAYKTIVILSAFLFPVLNASAQEAAPTAAKQERVAAVPKDAAAGVMGGVDLCVTCSNGGVYFFHSFNGSVPANTCANFGAGTNVSSEPAAPLRRRGSTTILGYTCAMKKLTGPKNTNTL